MPPQPHETHKDQKARELAEKRERDQATPADKRAERWRQLPEFKGMKDEAEG